jgi:hypothetical protein
MKKFYINNFCNYLAHSCSVKPFIPVVVLHNNYNCKQKYVISIGIDVTIPTFL